MIFADPAARRGQARPQDCHRIGCADHRAFIEPTIRIQDCLIGVKVECIPHPTDDYGGPLEVGPVYTIAGRLKGRFDGRLDIGLLLEEVAPPEGFQIFDQARFRLVPPERVDRFEAMLAGATRETVDAGE